MKKGVKCRKDVFNSLVEAYDRIVIDVFKGDYISAIKSFDKVAEENIRNLMSKFYWNPKGADQAWKTCKGSLYEYAVLRCLEEALGRSPLGKRYSVIKGDVNWSKFKDQIAIRNWSEIYPDVDLLLVDRERNIVRAIISCKTSLRERLTETAFWKRELERSDEIKDVKVILVTTDKDDELKSETNRYITLHVLDRIFITDPNKYESLIKYYTERYGERNDFEALKTKIMLIDDFEKFLKTLT